VGVAAVLSRTADPLAPLLATLTRLQAPPIGADATRPPLTGLEPGLRVPGLHIPGSADGRVLAQDLLRPESRAIDDLLDTAKQRWRAAPHAAAALAWKCYSYWTSLPAVLGYAVSQRVPLMTPDAVTLRWSNHQPFLTVGLVRPRIAVLATDPIALARDPDVVVVPDLEALRGALRTSLIDAHLDPIVERLHDKVHVGRRTLWGSVASGVAHGLSRAADVLPCSTLDTARDLLSLFEVDDLVSLAEVGAGLDVQRRTCCLAFTLPEPKICAGCVLTAPQR
jgi:hypothetical protein